jgi:preprotein translocase subunit SecE
MGRILRKKPTILKKKKRPEDAVAPETADPSAEAGRAGGASEAEGEVRRRTAPAVPRKPMTATAAAPSSPPADNVLTRSVQFLREVKIELKKVTWPSRQQTMGSTLVVIVLVMIISVFLGTVDLGLSGVVRALFK